MFTPRNTCERINGSPAQTITDVLNRCVQNGMATYLEKVSNFQKDQVCPDAMDTRDRILTSIMKSSRLSKIEESLAASVTKMLLNDARASGPTDPSSILPFQNMLTAEEVRQIGDNTNNFSLIAIARSDIGCLNVTFEERNAILEHAGFLRGPCIAPCSAKRMNGRNLGISTYEVIGPDCVSIHVKDVFDMLSPGRLSLATAVLTARQTGTKIVGGIDNYAYYECIENNPGAVPGENWQRCGGMFAISKSLAEAWNASVQAYYRSPVAGTQEHADIQRMLFTVDDAQRVCAAISLAARAQPELAEKELNSFFPHISSKEARQRGALLQRHNAEHISHIPTDDVATRAHVDSCASNVSLGYGVSATNKTSGSDNANKTQRSTVNGTLKISDGTGYLWLAPTSRTANMYTQPPPKELVSIVSKTKYTNEGKKRNMARVQKSQIDIVHYFSRSLYLCSNPQSNVLPVLSNIVDIFLIS
jgi:hypothetical protein